MARPGERLADRYQLLEPIGAGGMATVWRARDTRLRRTVAVKILRPQFAEDPEFVARFESEARHAASLAHPNVAAVYDTGFDPGPDGGVRYIVMELIDGPTVGDLLRGGPLPALQAVDIAMSAARALAAAHRRGIVHRDVKPGNLLIGPDGRVRLADFGIARALASSRLTTAGAMFGSAPYMSPEQARGEEALAPSDIYSLGVVLHEMLLGRLPDRAAPSAERAEYDRTDIVDGHGPASLPAGLDAILARALETNPADRYPSARVFAEALESAARRLRRAARAARARPEGAGADAVAPTAAAAASRQARTRKGKAVFTPRRLAVTGSAGTAGRATTATVHGAFETTRFADARPVGSRPLSRPVAGLPARTGSDDRRDARDRRPILPVVVGIASIATAFAIAIALFSMGARSLGGVLGATATPPAIAVATPTATPSVGPSGFAAPSVSASPSSSPSAGPSPTFRPTPTPTPPLTPAATTDRPTTAVADFYDAVADHDWARAISRWSASMQRRYPPDDWLIGRFARTTRIDITRLRQVAINTAAGTATVAVTLIEYRTVEPSPRTFSGTWDLVRVNGRWLLNEPHF